MLARNFQSDINGRIAELIKDDKSRFMKSTDYSEFAGTGPFKDRKGLLFKINIPEGFISITLTATDHDPEEVVVRLDKDRHSLAYERKFSDGSYDDNYQLGYIVYREVCKRLESTKSLDGLIEEYRLEEVG